MISGRFATCVALSMAAALLTGCLQPSLHPLVQPADAVFDERLLGDWACGSESESESWRFVSASEEFDGRPFRHYIVEITENGRVSKLRAWIGGLGARTFINFFPEGDDAGGNDFFDSHVVPMHTFGRLRIERDAVQLDMLESAWIKDASDDGRIALGVKDWSGDSILLTANTEALRAFATAHADNDQVFGEHVELVRQGVRQPGDCL